MVFAVRLAFASTASLLLLTGCEMPPPPAASAERPTLAANPPAVRKHHDCVYDTGSRVCRDADEEQDGAALAGSGTPDIQAGRVPAGLGFH